jgi:hypothetical protein
MIVEQTFKTNCLKHNGINKTLSTSSCFYSDDTLGFRYSDSTGQLSVGLLPLAAGGNITLNQTGLCVAYGNLGNSVLRECSMEDINQRWIYYNAEFYLSSVSTKKLVISGIYRWTKGGSLPYLPNAIVLTGSLSLHAPLCLEIEKTTFPTVFLNYCDRSPSQSWWMVDGLIKSTDNWNCITRSEPNKAAGISLGIVMCDKADSWHWRDGSLYLDSDEEYLIESDNTGKVIMGYIPDERVRRTHQRWLVESKRYSTYHDSTNSIRLVCSCVLCNVYKYVLYFSNTPFAK